MRRYLRWALAWLTPLWLVAWLRTWCLNCDTSGWRWRHQFRRGHRRCGLPDSEDGRRIGEALTRYVEGVG